MGRAGSKGRGWGALLLCGCLLTASVSQAQDAEEQARAHFRLGRAHYSNGDFAKAAAEFLEAYNVSHRPALLYNLYLAYRDADDKRNAADALRRYLAEEKEIDNRGQLEARLRILESSIAESTPPPIAPAPPPVAPALEPAQPAAQPAAPEQPATAEPEPAAATTDPANYDAAPAPSRSLVVPIALMAGGGAMVVTSMITGAMASSKQSDLEDGCPDKMNCDPALQDTADSGETLALVTDILLFGGIAVAGVGVALFVLGGDESSESDAASASLACVPGACAGSVRVAF